jgi:GDP-4-dehydro-6-deoxy-D-mannose reductase
MNAYAATKAAADVMLSQMARQGLRVIRLRPFNHTGAGQSPQFVAPAFASQIARIEHGAQPPVIRVGELSSRRDFLDVRDIVEAYARTLMAFDDLPNGIAINLASGGSRTIQSVLDDLLSLSKVKVAVEIDPARLRPSEIPIAEGDATRAHTLLGWKPQYAWADTLASVLDYWRAQKPA